MATVQQAPTPIQSLPAPVAVDRPDPSCPPAENRFLIRNIDWAAYRQISREYVPTERSRYFPFVTGVDLTRFLAQAAQMDESSLARSFHEWVQAQVGRAS